jgi:hypothetical protein
MYFAHHIGELKSHVLLGFEWAIHEGFNRTHRALYLPERPHEQSTAIGSPKATKIGRVGGDIMVALFVLCETGHRHPASSGAWWPPGSLLARRVGAASHCVTLPGNFPGLIGVFWMTGRELPVGQGAGLDITKGNLRSRLGAFSRSNCR